MWHTEFWNPKEFCKNLRKYLIRVFYCILPVTPEFEFDMGRKASSQQPWHVTKATTRAILARACITCLNVANTFPVQCSRAMKSAPSQRTETSWEAGVRLTAGEMENTNSESHVEGHRGKSVSQAHTREAR